jgi:hypothetical protein
LNFEFFIDWFGDEADRRELVFSQIELPGSTRMDSRWQIGMRIDLSQIVYVIFLSTNGQRHELQLLDIVERFGQGRVYIDESESATRGSR